ncbi:unnamed protein product [Sphagnum balticum]
MLASTCNNSLIPATNSSTLIFPLLNSDLPPPVPLYLPSPLWTFTQSSDSSRKAHFCITLFFAQLTEKEFHEVSGDMLDQLQEKIETFGEELDIEGFEVDYSDGVLTVQLGSKGTYVINKQTPNRQIWLSSPISGPARFDWHGLEHVWVYRRTKAQLLPLLEQELSQLMGKSITLKD